MHGIAICNPDLKTENCFLKKVGTGYEMRMGDLAGCVPVGSKIEEISPLYVAPERTKRNALAATAGDIYQLGGSFYELACGLVKGSSFTMSLAEPGTDELHDLIRAMR